MYVIEKLVIQTDYILSLPFVKKVQMRHFWMLFKLCVHSLKSKIEEENCQKLRVCNFCLSAF